MRRRFLGDSFDKGRLRLLLAAFFFALAVPAVVLVLHANRQLRWETFHQYQGMADELARRIDGRIVQLIDDEEKRSFGDYSFLIVTGDSSTNFLQRSPLSSYPVTSKIPGLIGYFQVDDQGLLSTPLLPPSGADAGAFGVPPSEYALRVALEGKILDALTQNRLVGRQAGALTSVAGQTDDEDRLAERIPSVAREDSQESLRDSRLEAARRELSRIRARRERSPAGADSATPGQAAFDRLSTYSPYAAETEKKARANALGKTGDLKLDQTYQAQQEQPATDSTPPQLQNNEVGRRSKRKEQIVLPDTSFDDTPAGAPVRTDTRVRTFESEIDPFEFSLLDSGHFVLFRKVWREGQRYIQGAVIDSPVFIDGIVRAAFRQTALRRMSDLVVAWQGDVVSVFGARTQGGILQRLRPSELTGELLYQTRMSAPLSDLELIFSVRRLPAGPGGVVIGWVSAILAAVFFGGFWLLYRLGVGQIDLARQQQDFVSAVSHELKTPLTSIRMYGEMLKEGWADEEKKKSYYAFIYDESERLSRLIGNVLQLASMTRNDPRFDMRRVSVAELFDQVRSKIASQVEQAGFELSLDRDPDAQNVHLSVDGDCFAQIFINLVDNAIKFSARASDKSIGLSTRLQRDGTVQFAVRDHGPGIPKDQMKKIFRLFYRTENELTRETVGTGIGLALVHQLAAAMDGTVNVVNRDPGAEFRVSFPSQPV